MPSDSGQHLTTEPPIIIIIVIRGFEASRVLVLITRRHRIQSLVLDLCSVMPCQVCTSTWLLPPPALTPKRNNPLSYRQRYNRWLVETGRLCLRKPSRHMPLLCSAARTTVSAPDPIGRRLGYAAHRHPGSPRWAGTYILSRHTLSHQSSPQPRLSKVMW